MQGLIPLMLLLDAFFYIAGLLLLLMPARSIPWFDGEDPAVRLGKHGLGLILFAWGTIRIHQEIRVEAGDTFLLSSVILVLVVMLGKVWWSSREDEE